MSKIYGFFLAASAVLFVSAGVYAGDKALLALNTVPVQDPQIKTAALLPAATAQAAVTDLESSDFDALSSAGDPLYREGSREFLEQVSAQDAAKGDAKKAEKPALRDAPADNGKAPAAVPARKPALGKLKLKKPVHADPLKVKDTL